MQDCLHYREPPGDGEFDLRVFLELLPDAAPLSVEVIDDDLDLLAPAATAALLMEATRSYLWVRPSLPRPAGKRGQWMAAAM